MGADIRSAQDRLLRVQREMEVTGRRAPVRGPRFGAMHRLSVDTSLMMRSCHAEMEKYRLGDGDTEKLA
jgi:hypothetical protein